MSRAATIVEDEDDLMETESSVQFAQENAESQEAYIRRERYRGDSGRWSYDDAERPAERPKRGRKEHLSWTQFKKVSTGTKKAHPDAVCIHCGLQINNGKPNDNLKRHLLEHCTKITPPQKAKVKRMYNMPVEAPASVDKAADGSQAAAPSPPQFANEHEFHLYYARQIFAHNLPMCLVERKFWRQLFKIAFPNFNLPTRQKLVNQLLDAVYKEVQETTEQTIHVQEYVGVVTDGWTNPNPASIVNYVIVAPGMKSLLWTSQATGAEAHDAENLKAGIEGVIDDVQTKTGAVVAGVNTDHAEAQVKSWKLLEMEWPIFGGGCAAHALNLLMNDMLAKNTIAEVTKMAMDVIRFVRDYHAIQHIFNELIDESADHHHGLSVPPTRWYSTVQALKSVRDNEKELARLFVGDLKEDTQRRYSTTAAQRQGIQKVQRLWVIDSRGKTFFTRLKNILDLFEPIIDALKVLESDKAWISDAYERFKALLVHPVYAKGSARQTPLQKAFCEAIEDRWCFVHTDGMGIGFLLDPRMNLDEFVGDDKNDSIKQAVDFMKRGSEKHPSLLDRLQATEAQFKDHLYAFLEDKTKRHKIDRVSLRSVSPRGWWAVHGSEYPVVDALARFVFALPTSTGAAERVWSVFGNVHSKKQSNTDVERANKLAFIYTNNQFDQDPVFSAARDQTIWGSG